MKISWSDFIDEYLQFFVAYSYQVLGATHK